MAAAFVVVAEDGDGDAVDVPVSPVREAGDAGGGGGGTGEPSLSSTCFGDGVARLKLRSMASWRWA